MPQPAMMAACRRLWRRARAWLPSTGKRGGVAIMFAVTALPIVIGVGAGIDIAGMMAARTALQQAVDNAALSGAAAYTAYTQGDAFNVIARTIANSAFCDASRALPSGYVVSTTSGGGSCGSQTGPAVSATIAGAAIGTRGVVAGSGCSATNSVVTGATCGFVVTVTATATGNSLFSGLWTPNLQVTVTASAINPFINISQALNASLSSTARYANSIWVYPLLLDASGSPAVTSSNPGALPDASACTDDPTQTSCGVYTMLASTNYINCPGQTTPSCSVNGTTFSAGGVATNPAAGAAVITATTPLGVAFESSSGGGFSQPAGTRASYGYDRSGPFYGTAPPYQSLDGCVWPWHTAYNTVNQVYSPSGAAIYPWSLVTHWFYSSSLLSNQPPSYQEIAAQTNVQVVRATPQVIAGSNFPSTCSLSAYPTDLEHYSTTYPTTGNTNCSLYIVKDPTSLTPTSSYVGSCFNPASTPGQANATFSCQNIAGHTLAFFWNDMGGGGSDDQNYGDGTFTINCNAQPQVRLIN